MLLDRQHQTAMLHKAHLNLDSLRLAIVLWYVLCLLLMIVLMSHTHEFF